MEDEHSARMPEDGHLGYHRRVAPLPPESGSGHRDGRSAQDGAQLQVFGMEGPLGVGGSSNTQQAKLDEREKTLLDRLMSNWTAEDPTAPKKRHAREVPTPHGEKLTP